MRKTFYLTFIALMIITACQSKSKNASDDNGAIRDIIDQWVNAIKSKDINKVISIFASDAVEMPPNEPIAVDIEAIKKGWELWFSDTTYLHNAYTYKIDNIEVSTSGDLGYVRGTNHYSIKTQNGIVEFDDKSIDIFRKKNGEWKCIISIWNNNKSMGDQ